MFLTIVQRLTEVVMINDLTFGLPLSRLGIAQASLALLSLLHRLSMRTSVKRMIPRAESPSKVLFPSSHPSVHVVRVVLVVFKTKISVRICVIRGQILLLDFELNFEQFLAER